jgi:hypothetical protein
MQASLQQSISSGIWQDFQSPNWMRHVELWIGDTSPGWGYRRVYQWLLFTGARGWGLLNLRSLSSF